MVFQDDNRNSVSGPSGGALGGGGENAKLNNNLGHDTYDPENFHEPNSAEQALERENRNAVREQERELYEEEQGSGGIGRTEPDNEDRDDEELNIAM